MLAAILMPIAGRLPFEWVYPIGEKQEEAHTQVDEALRLGDGDRRRRTLHQTLHAGQLDGKIVVTNTTTPDDVEMFRKAEVKYLVTSTPGSEGARSGPI